MGAMKVKTLFQTPMIMYASPLRGAYMQTTTHYNLTIAAALAVTMLASPAMAEGLSGDWGGQRQQMEDNGISVNVGYTGEAVRNFDPGLNNPKKVTTYHDNLDLELELDSEKAGLWSGGTLYVHGLRNHGGDPTANVIGDLQTASNIEAPDQFIVHEAWYEQAFVDGDFSLLLGLHDMNSEFYVSEYASLMLNSSFGIGPEVSGNVPASLFPQAGLGARLYYAPFEGVNIRAAIYDGDPATRGFKAGEGEMVVVETGFSDGENNSVKAGYWMHSANPTFSGVTFNRNYGFYGIIDREIMPLEDGAVGIFMQYGSAPSDRNQVYGYFGAGLHVQGAIPGRAEDQFGLAIARATSHNGINVASVTESTTELTYRAQIMPWLVLQPSFQWISNPGAVNTNPSIKVGLLRFEASL